MTEINETQLTVLQSAAKRAKDNLTHAAYELKAASDRLDEATSHCNKMQEMYDELSMFDVSNEE